MIGKKLEMSIIGPLSHRVHARFADTGLPFVRRDIARSSAGILTGLDCAAANAVKLIAFA